MSLKSLKQRIWKGLGVKSAPAPVTPYEHLLTLPRYQEVTVELLGRPFRVADPLSFYWSYREIFQEGIYRFETTNPRPVIVDCGSNYGTSVVYFQATYPEAEITAVEADPRVFALLSSNLDQVQGAPVRRLNQAVSDSDAPVSFHHEGADSGRIHPLGNDAQVFEVPAVKLDELISRPIDFLKMDIEGAETAAICSAENLDNVQQMFIEFHSFADAEQTLSDVLEKLKSSGFRYYIQTQFCSPRPLTEPETYLGMDLQLNIFARKPTGMHGNGGVDH